MALLVLQAAAARAGVVAADLAHLAGARADGKRGRAAAAVLRGRLARAAGTAPAVDSRRWRRLLLDLDVEHGRHDLGLDRLRELVEHDEGLVLVLDQGVALPVAAEADALLQVLHVGEVV